MILREGVVPIGVTGLVAALASGAWGWWPALPVWLVVAWLCWLYWEHRPPRPADPRGVLAPVSGRVLDEGQPRDLHRQGPPSHRCREGGSRPRHPREIFFHGVLGARGMTPLHAPQGLKDAQSLHAAAFRKRSERTRHCRSLPARQGRIR